MAKKVTKRKKSSKKKSQLAKSDQPKTPEATATIVRNGKKVTITKEGIAKTNIPPSCIIGWHELNEHLRKVCHNTFRDVKAALCSNSKELQDTVIDTILGDLVIGAYQDKLVVYYHVPAEDNAYSLDAIAKMQRIRQAADTHLLSMLKAVRDIKRPPVTVVVKEAEQVNVAEQINQADKQVNISQKQPS